jgi:hypothetical protein
MRTLDDSGARPSIDTVKGSNMRRVAPAIALFFLAPLIAEYLLGDLPITYLAALVALAPMYGGGAVLIREMVRRSGRGWPSIVLLAIAFGLFEEGIATQSLFNPDYYHAHLLDHGFIPALGIALPWTLYVVALHAVWSISTPVALVEALTPSRRNAPWLRTSGLVVSIVVFLGGATFMTVTSYRTDHFIAPWPRLVAVLLVVATLSTLALRGPRRGSASPSTTRAPSAWLVFAVAVVAGVVFMAAQLAAWVLPAWVSVAAASADLAGVVWMAWAGSRRAGWNGRHRLALAAGAVVTYGWHSFTFAPLVETSSTVAVVSHAVFAGGAVVLLVVAMAKLPKSAVQLPSDVDAPTPARLS